MLHWYGFLEGATKNTPLTSRILALPSGLISAGAWSLLAVADTIENIALSLFNLLTCCCYPSEPRLSDAGFYLARFFMSGVFILTIPIVAPALAIKSTVMMVFEPHSFAMNSYDLFHKAVYESY